jgi:hypothetical protein
MSDEHAAPDPGLKAIESALGALTPAGSRMDRDRVMYLAGRAASRPDFARPRAWAALAACFAALAAGEAALLARRPPPRVIERVVVVHEPAGTRAGPTPPRADAPPPRSPRESGVADVDFAFGESSHARLAEQVLRYGLDGLPAAPAGSRGAAGRPAASSHELLLEELGKVLNPGDPS